MPEALRKTAGVRTCVIFNPAARGEAAKRLRHYLDVIGSYCTLKFTAAPNDARRLAAEAVTENFEVIAAAGGDGTVNEVINGIGDVPHGFERVRLGILPLGTVNVFARELGIPSGVWSAWKTLLHERETRIDLPWVEYACNGTPHRRYFAQLAGAGLDARAVELVDLSHKKKIGPGAYLLAGFKALRFPQPPITVSAPEGSATGGLVLMGNGKFYGGRYKIFPDADIHDGLLEVCVFPRVNWWTLARCAPVLLALGKVPEKTVQRIRAASFTLTSSERCGFELDGEFAGHLPATFGVLHCGLRVTVP